jgi:hypothetical protein
MNIKQEFNIVYAPGTGGNHIANIISLDKKYSLSVDLSCYDDIDSSSPHVHQSLPRENEKVKIDTLHIGSFLKKCKQDNFSSHDKNILILLPKFNESNLAWERLKYWAKQYQDQFIFVEHNQVYSKFLVSKISDQEWYTIHSSLLFNENVSWLMSLLNQIGVTVDTGKVQEYHKKWLKKIQHYVEQQSIYTQ